jgi:hypothetical protein
MREPARPAVPFAAATLASLSLAACDFNHSSFACANIAGRTVPLTRIPPDGVAILAVHTSILVKYSVSDCKSKRAAMANPTGEAHSGAPKRDFDRRLMLRFGGSVITSDGWSLAHRELDDVLALAKIGGERCTDARIGKSGRHPLVGLLRLWVFGRLAGYEDVKTPTVCAAAMLEPVKGFRRLEAHRQLPALRATYAACQANHIANTARRPRPPDLFKR